MIKKLFSALFILTLLMSLAAMAAPKPKITIGYSGVKEELFQHHILIKALEKMGYEVAPPFETPLELLFDHISKGQTMLTAAYQAPYQENFLKNVSVPEKAVVIGLIIPAASEGVYIDKKTADHYQIDDLQQLKDRRLAELFDFENDHYANLIGCEFGWACRFKIEEYLRVLQLYETVNQVQKNYIDEIKQGIKRYKDGKPILYYARNPSWVNAILVPGQDVVRLKVENPSVKPRQAFQTNTQHIVVNADFLKNNRNLQFLLEHIQIPLADLNQEHLRIFLGENDTVSIEKHANDWIKQNQALFDSWTGSENNP